MMEVRNVLQQRTRGTAFETREGENGKKIIAGYFVVFNTETELFPGAFESVDPGAFDETLGGDIRALTNHDTTLVLGRTKAGTLMLRIDSHGLWGEIEINENDTDALNLYERVRRGDVDQCSFGFDILEEETEWRENGTVKWTIKKVELYEVSVCTFPAYKDTGVQARHEAIGVHKEALFKAKKSKSMSKLKGGNTKWL